MATIKLLSLENSSSLSELSHEDTDSVTGGALQVYAFIFRTSGNRRNAISNARSKYQRVFRETRSASRALTASLSSVE